jgi:6-phosphofructo-2-kinase/fructose-2,6-biphosphatase 4
LELEREQDDLLIVAHESVLRVLYGYLMACGASEIPKLQFPRDEIIEVRPDVDRLRYNLLTLLFLQIVPASYNNEARRIHVPGLPPRIIPDSPEDLKHPVAPSGMVTPFSGIGTPAGTSTPESEKGGPRTALEVNIHPSK